MFEDQGGVLWRPSSTEPFLLEFHVGDDQLGSYMMFTYHISRFPTTGDRT